MTWRTKLEWPVATVGSAVVVAWLALAADAVGRRAWEDVQLWDHLRAGLLLYGLVGVAFGVPLGLGVASVQALSEVARRRAPRMARWIAPVCGALAASAAAAPTAFWAFSGHGVQASGIARVGPYLLIVAAFLAGGVAVSIVTAAIRHAEAGARWFPIGASLLFAIATCFAVVVDLTVYVSLYSRLHTAVEAVAALGAMGTLLPCLAMMGRKHARLRAWVTGIPSGGALLLAIFYVTSTDLRASTETALRHAWREPVYVGRMLSRVQLAESYLRDPGGFHDVTMSSIVRLRRRFDLSTTARSPIWDAAPPEPEEVRRRLLEMRGDARHNIVVFYVDTLRADVARDPSIMPATVRFASQALSFDRAYSTGSNTVHALPGLTGGNFDLMDSSENDLVRVAERGGMTTALVIAQSANEFLRRLLPTFTFGETLAVPDYAPGNDTVWGYGADQPTAERIVSRAEEWMIQHRAEPFLLWLFNFDVHNWREIDEAYVKATAKALGVPDDGLLAWRYRVVARAIDAQFHRLLERLDELMLSDRTIVVFVSDHGEALGREGFWVHSIFLWEPLIRVPLAIRIPKFAPRVVHDMVSLVDVAPTLARFVVPEAEMRGYHGEDLLRYLLPKRPVRRLPLLLAGTSKEQLVRLGIIDPPSPWKLVVPLEGGLPELYDLTSSDPDARNLAGQRPHEVLRLLNQLVRAPLFPRMSPEGAVPGLEREAPGGGGADGQAAR